MKIAIGCDHPAYVQKKSLIKHLVSLGHTVYDCGTFSPLVRTHYPIYGHKLACLVAKREVELGIAVCGTGVGISSSCIRVKNIRCALVSNAISAKIAREKYAINVIAIGGLVVGENTARDIIDTFLNTKPKPQPEIFNEFLEKVDKLTPVLADNLHIFDRIITNWERGNYTEGNQQDSIHDVTTIKIIKPKR